MGLYAPKPERNFNIDSVEPSDLEIALLVKRTRLSFTDPPPLLFVYRSIPRRIKQLQI